MIEPLQSRVVEVLGVGPGMKRVDRQHTSADAYVCDERVRGSRVLLVDDTYTTGAHLQAAAAALRQAGAIEVIPLVVGRRMRREWVPSAALLDWSSEPANRWDPHRCIHCWYDRGGDT